MTWDAKYWVDIEVKRTDGSLEALRRMLEWHEGILAEVGRDTQRHRRKNNDNY